MKNIGNFIGHYIEDKFGFQVHRPICLKVIKNVCHPIWKIIDDSVNAKITVPLRTVES